LSAATAAVDAAIEDTNATPTAAARGFLIIEFSAIV
jgi:hypothetical protein